MSSLTEQIFDKGYADRILSDHQIASITGGSKARRYGLVNRALKDGSLLRLKRGLYALGPRYRSIPLHPYAIAQAMLPGSYISMETALSFHGWIPEAVYETISITPGRKTRKLLHKKFGQFIYYPLALKPYQFLQSVQRHEAGTQFALVADPLRALMDIIAYRKTAWTGLDWLEHGLRIDPQHLAELNDNDFEALASVYKHTRARTFLKELQTELRNTQ